MRLIQHKREAFWFYRFLSHFYDRPVNPLFWTLAMRTRALELARLNHHDLRTLDVGSGTGFTTEGILEKVAPAQVTCLDQSPHQMSKAIRKRSLDGCTFQVGDAEKLPFPVDTFDRYVSAGSIEYWPEPQRGITEAYRVLTPGGVALIIGPLRPANRLARSLADLWMLFPEEQDYLRWFTQAGFTDIETCYIAPSWHSGRKYGLAVSGVKPRSGQSPLHLGLIKEDRSPTLTTSQAIPLTARLVAGSAAGFAFILIALAKIAIRQSRRLIR